MSSFKSMLAAATLFSTIANAQNSVFERYPPEAIDWAGAEFRKIMIPIAESLRVVRGVSYCLLRSERWSRTLILGLTMGIDADESRLRKMSSNVVAFDATAKATREWSARFQFPAIPGRAECVAVSNSPELQALDVMYQKVTGNYH